MQTRLLVVIALALGAPACVVGSGDKPDDWDEPTQDDMPPYRSEAALGNGARTAFNFFVSKGLSEEQAAGVVGNLMQESSVSPTAVQPGGPGRGIAQWSIGGRWNGSGASTVYKYAASRGLNRWSLSTQLDFIWHELVTYPAYGFAQLQSASTVTQAVTVFQNKYEICGACEQTKRIQYAQQALRDYGGATTGTTDPSDPGGTDPTDPGGTDPDPGTTDVPGTGCYSGTLERDVPMNTCVESVFDGYWYQCAYGSWIDRWSDPDPCIAEYPL